LFVAEEEEEEEEEEMKTTNNEQHTANANSKKECFDDQEYMYSTQFCVLIF
jgi:hypothetical protein